MDIKFGYTIVYVEDVPKILDFYGRAFGFITKFLHEDHDYGELDTGNTIIGFANHNLGKMNLPNGYISASSRQPLGMELVFVTTKVQEVLENAIQAGGKKVQPVVLKPWGQKVAYLRDPAGILIELCSPMTNND